QGCRAQGAAVGVSRLKLRPVRHFQVVSGRGVKAARDVNGRVRAKDDAARIDQVKIGSGDGRLYRAVDRRWAAAGDPANYIADGPATTRRGKGCALGNRRVEKAELAKTVKEVAADLLAKVCANRIVGPDQRLRRPEAFVYRDMLRRSLARRDGRQTAGH